MRQRAERAGRLEVYDDPMPLVVEVWSPSTGDYDVDDSFNDTTAVAAILGKSPGAVRIALHRGLRVLAADPRIQALEEVEQ